MPQRWAVWMAVYGDLRFASHHDMMRVIERALLRGNLPLKYSQGFSPRAILSLAFPRPVGAAAERDLLVLNLEAPMLRDQLLEAANSSCPKGLEFTDAIRLDCKSTPQPCRCAYRIGVPAGESERVAGRVEEFSAAETFPIRRTKPPKRRGRRDGGAEPVARTLDLKLLIDDVRFDGETLSWRQSPRQTIWAKPAEAMKAFGLDPAGAAAMLTRTSLELRGFNEYSGPADGESDDGPETKQET